MLRRGVLRCAAAASGSASSGARTAVASSAAGPKRRVFLVGGDMTPFIGKGHPDFVHKKHKDFGKRENPPLEHYFNASVTGALAKTGVPADRIQKAWASNFAGELFSSQGHLGAALVGADPALRFIPSARVEAACASGGVAFSAGVTDIRAGLDVVLIAGGEAQNTVSARVGGDYLARAAHYARQRSLDEFTFPALFARRMKHYRTRFNVSERDIAHVSVKAYANGNLNPLAHMRAIKMSLDQASVASDTNPNFLANKELKPWLKTSDCSQVSDGGAALILASEEGLASLGKKAADCIEVLAVEMSTDSLYTDGDLGVMETTRSAAKKAFATARLTPADIQVAEVHDCFSIAEVLMMEAIGWAPQGKGWTMAAEGVSTLTGKIPVNTGGGLISFGHPVGATGIKQVLEVAKQLQGTAGAYQVKSKPTIGLTANMGGDDKTAVVSILRKA